MRLFITRPGFGLPWPTTLSTIYAFINVPVTFSPFRGASKFFSSSLPSSIQHHCSCSSFSLEHSPGPPTPHHLSPTHLRNHLLHQTSPEASPSHPVCFASFMSPQAPSISFHHSKSHVSVLFFSLPGTGALCRESLCSPRDCVMREHAGSAQEMSNE